MVCLFAGVTCPVVSKTDFEISHRKQLEGIMKNFNTHSEGDHLAERLHTLQVVKSTHFHVLQQFETTYTVSILYLCTPVCESLLADGHILQQVSYSQN